MSQHVTRSTQPVKVEIHPEALAPHAPTDRNFPVTVVLLVTWNRRNDVSNVIGALSRQEYPLGNMHVVVVDNASNDGTQDFLTRRWRPERIVENPTDKAHEPRFERPSIVVLPDEPPNLSPAKSNGQHHPARPEAPSRNGAVGEPRNAGGFASLTIVRNHANLGGCGGFNTGLAYIRHAFCGEGAGAPDFAWLVDDDTDLPPDALGQLTRAAAIDPKIGLVGSRTVDIADRKKTIETTIFLDRVRGVMQDHPHDEHTADAAHRDWLKTVGSTRGQANYTGIRDVDVVSACSMLARWDAVEKVGFWDWRYFIYCDDADWCLRFGKAGYRVVLNLDAVVYHTPWNMKLTVARIYYAQRNLLWMLQKVLPRKELRRITTRRMASILRDSLHAAFHRRLFHADIIRRTALDVATNRAGKLQDDGPMPEPIIDALRKAGALRPGATVAALCALPGSIEAADAIRLHIHSLRKNAPEAAEPRWVYCIRNNVAELEEDARPAPPPAARIIYGGRWPSRLRRQFTLWHYRPAAVIVFDQTNDFPALAGGWNVHTDLRSPLMGQLERDGVRRRARFLFKWCATVIRCMVFARTVKPYTSTTLYG